MEWFRTIDGVEAGEPDRGSGIYTRLPDGRVVELHRDGDRVRGNVVHANATGNGYDDASTRIRQTFASFSEGRRYVQARFGNAPTRRVTDDEAADEALRDAFGDHGQGGRMIPELCAFCDQPVTAEGTCPWCGGANYEEPMDGLPFD